MHLSAILSFCLCFIIISVRSDDRSVIRFNDTYISLIIGDNYTVNAQLVNTSISEPIVFQFIYDGKIIPESEHIELIPNITLDDNKTSENFHIVGKLEGHLVLAVQSSQINVSANVDYILLDIARSNALNILIQVVGWIYFAAWSISFYPQIYENFRRRSVIGLNFDFLALNLLGHSCYTVYNVSMYASADIQHQYHERYPHGVLPVLLNDVRMKFRFSPNDIKLFLVNFLLKVIFSAHAVLATVVTVIQCLVYERGNQRVSYVARVIAAVMLVFLLISSIVALSSRLSPLDLLYFISYVKLAITIIKYCPQAWMNYRRKSTVGWSIGNILLDFTGGLLSLIQMFFLAQNYDDWSSIFGSPTKLGLGLFSIFFDVIFIIQHYICYRTRRDSDDDDTEPINQKFDDNPRLIYSKS